MSIRKLAFWTAVLFLALATVAGWSQIFPHIPGDANGDGFVGPDDLLTVQSNWGRGERRVRTLALEGLESGARPIRMIRLQPASYLRGSTETERGTSIFEHPVQTISFTQPFHLSETEVTQAQWRAVMGELPQALLDNPSGLGNDHPVYGVSWEDCQEFISRLNAAHGGEGKYRLPSEAEWEYACRAGSMTRFHFGDSLDCVDGWEDCAAGTLDGNRTDYLWYGGNNIGGPFEPGYGAKPVDSKLPNAFGFHGMHGNVREWCQDWAYGDYTGAPLDGSPWEDAPSGLRTVRDGAWFSPIEECRSAARIGVAPDVRANDIGFRIAFIPPVPATPTPTETVTPSASPTPSNTPVGPTATFTPTETATPTPTFIEDPCDHPYQGSYSGQYQGALSGTASLTVDRFGRVTGVSSSPFGTAQLIGVVTLDGNLLGFFRDNANYFGAFVGTFGSNGASGRFENEFGEEGTWSVTRQSGTFSPFPDSCNHTFQGNYSGQYQGDEFGTLSITVDRFGNAAGSAMSAFGAGELLGMLTGDGLFLGYALDGSSLRGVLVGEFGANQASGSWGDVAGGSGVWSLFRQEPPPTDTPSSSNTSTPTP